MLSFDLEQNSKLPIRYDYERGGPTYIVESTLVSRRPPAI
jgi:hypothetical protein